MNSTFMEGKHDVLYNPIRPLLEKVFPIAPTTPSMELWEDKGYAEGYYDGQCRTDDTTEVAEMEIRAVQSAVGP